MKYLIYLLAVIILVALTQGVLRQFAVFGVVPDLLFLLVVGLALAGRPMQQLIIAAILAGVFADLSSGLLAGSFILGYALAAVAVSAASENWLAWREHWWYLPLSLLSALLMLYIWLGVYNFLALLVSQGAVLHSAVLAHQFLPAFFYNLLLFYPMYFFAAWLARRADRLDARQHFGV